MHKIKKQFNIKTKNGVYKVRIWWDNNDKAFLAKATSLPDVCTFGTSLKDVKRMIKDAIELYCDCLFTEKKVVIDDLGFAFGHIPKTRILASAK